MPSKHYKRKSLSKSKKNGKKTIKRSSHRKKTRTNLKNMKGGNNISKYVVYSDNPYGITTDYLCIELIFDDYLQTNLFQEDNSDDIIKSIANYFLDNSDNKICDTEYSYLNTKPGCQNLTKKSIREKAQIYDKEEDLPTELIKIDTENAANRNFYTITSEDIQKVIDSSTE